MIITRLSGSYAFVYRKLRLQALKSEPEMFDHEYEVEYKKSIKEFKKQIESNEIYGALTDDDQHHLTGIAAFTVRPEIKHSHKGLLWGMYVNPENRGSGIGRKLLTHIVDNARGRVEIIQLGVLSGNSPARRLYESLGFVEYGIERRAVKIGDQYFDDVWMALDLKGENVDDITS